MLNLQAYKCSLITLFNNIVRHELRNYNDIMSMCNL